MEYYKCPKCGKKGLHQLGLSEYNILMRIGVDYECKYCEYTEGLLEFNKREEHKGTVLSQVNLGGNKNG